MRARSLKPSLFHNEILASSDPIYTLAFEGLWCLADREGRLEDRPLKIKMLLFPLRNIDMDSILRWLHEQRFVLRYRVFENSYIQVVNFLRHQKPHANEKPSDIPPPDQGIVVDTTKAISDNNQGCAQDALNPSSLTPDSQKNKLRKSGGGDERFGRFWQAYPLRKGKGHCQRAWHKLQPDDELLAKMLAALEAQKAERQAMTQAGQFVPEWKYPATWLNGRCWEDEPMKPPAVPTNGSGRPGPPRSESDWQALGAKLGIHARPGESWDDFKRRIIDAQRQKATT